MKFDASSISSDALLYFLTHSGVYTAIVGCAFFILGLWFGGLTWGRYKRRCRMYAREQEAYKDEIASLKRKLAEQAVRLTAPPPEPEVREPEEMSYELPDPVVQGFLSTASKVLTQVHAGVPAEPPATFAPEEWTENPEEEEELADEPKQEEEKSEEDASVVAEPPAADELPVVETESSPPSSESKVPEETLSHETDHSVLKSVIDVDSPHVQLDAAAPEESVEVVEEAAPTKEEEPSAKSEELPAKTEASSAPEEKKEGANGATHESDSALVSDPSLGLIYPSKPEQVDDLTHLKGVASGIEGRLHEFGIYTFKQIALWNEDHIREVSSRLAFKDRIHREEWVQQARELHFQKYGERVGEGA